MTLSASFSLKEDTFNERKHILQLRNYCLHIFIDVFLLQADLTISIITVQKAGV